MDRLKELFSSHGFSPVVTFLQSGNIIVSSDLPRESLKRQVEQLLQKELEYDVPVFARSALEMLHLTENLPFEDRKEGRDTTYVCFLKEPLSEDQTAILEGLSNDIDAFVAIDREIHWYYNRSAGETTIITSKLEKHLKIESTRRNTNTLKRIVKKYFVK